MRRFCQNWPIRRQLILALGGTVIVFGIVSGELGRRLESASLRHNLQHQLTKTVNMLSAASIDAVITEDRPLLRTIVDQSVRYEPELLSLEISNEAGVALVEWKNEQTKPANPPLRFSQDIEYEGEVFGKIKIQWNLDNLRKQVNQHVQKMRVISIVAILFLAGLIIVWVHRLVIRPIQIINQQLNQLAQGKFKRAPGLSAARELRRLSDSVAVLRDTLEERQRREAELEAAKHDLSQARDAALSASRAKSEFLANMSHEIRTPINGVLGMLQLLQETSMNPEQTRFTQLAMQSGEVLMTLINDILDFSKIEAGHLELENIDFELRETIEFVTSALAGQAHAKGLELTCMLPVELPALVRGDPTRLTQVLTNLVGNAIKFTERGEVAVNASVRSSLDEHTYVRFEVQDTGIGISETAKNRLFDAFTQADGSTTRKYGGTGLGLAICKQLVELMGGEIKIDSSLGMGTRFWFTIPFGKSVALPAKPQETPIPAGLKTLLVDDNTTNLQILVHFLDNWGHPSTCAEDGYQALDLLRETARHGQPFQLAILDMQMPGMDGIELARAIKKDPLINATRLVMLTSLGETPQDWQQAGISAYLTKPIRKRLLQDAIAKALGNQILACGERDAGRAPDSHASSLVGRVLLAEDNTVNQFVACGLLDKLGVDVVVARDGHEVIEALSHEAIGLILMDIQMPGMDGFAATQIIREQEKSQGTQRLPIIAMTANAMSGDREACLSAGMDDYIAKPVKLDRLHSLLSRWLPDSPHAHSATQAEASPSEIESILASPAETAGDVLDIGILKELQQTLQNRFAPMLSAFLDETPRWFSQIRAALNINDTVGVRAFAHGFKSSCANLGAMRLAELAGQIEDLGRMGTCAGVDSLLRSAETEYLEVQTVLESYANRTAQTEPLNPLADNQLKSLSGNR